MRMMSRIELTSSTELVSVYRMNRTDSFTAEMVTEFIV